MSEILRAAIMGKLHSGGGGYPEPTGTITITANGSGIDVKDYAEADVNVPQPSGKITITENGTGIDVKDYAEADVNVPNPSTGALNIIQNGTYDVTDKASAVVAVPQPSGKITITQNGTGIDVSGYAEADVNVGGNDYGASIVDGTITAFVDNTITKIRPYTFSRCDLLQSARGDNVTEIGDYAFGNPNSISPPLTSVIFPKVERLGGQAFWCCNHLTGISFPLLEYMDNGAFQSCSALASAELPALEEIYSGAFSGCSSLSSLVLPALTTIGNAAFMSASGLTMLDLPVFAGTIPNQCFNSCSRLRHLILRSDTLVGLYGYYQCFQNTNYVISSQNAYIYVPASLVASYQAATNWSNMSARFRALEDYTVDGTTTGALDPTKI